MRRRCLAPVVAIGLTPLLGSCATVQATVHEPYPAVEIAEGEEDSDPKTLTLTADAVRRLELQTLVVKDATAIPFSAVIYDKTGAPWVYSSPQARTFIRVPVTVENVVGDTATVSAGPDAGTVVVTRAAIKLYGAETGVGGGH